VRFRYLHASCRTPLTVQRYCPVHEVVVPEEEVVRGYEVAPDEYVVVERAEAVAAETALARSRRIDIQAFVDQGEIDPIFYDASYYAEPRPEGRPAYALLQQAMGRVGRVAIARLALRARERLAAIRSYGDALLVQTLFYADELRPLTGLALPAEAVPPRELRTAIRLIEGLAEPFAAQRYSDEYHRRLMSLIEEKAERLPAAAEEGPASRLLSELQASLEAIHSARHEPA